MHSTKERGTRFTRVLGASAVALLLLAAGCSTSPQGGDPKVSATESRNKTTGVLEAITVKGTHFSANGDVLVTMLMAASGANGSPYVEETIKADASGKFTWVKRPVPCPTQPGYMSGSWTLVTGRDTSSGISGSANVHPGKQADCKA